jgi:hypothetical protein
MAEVVYLTMPNERESSRQIKPMTEVGYLIMTNERELYARPGQAHELAPAHHMEQE